jgi:hypothetical protein
MNPCSGLNLSATTGFTCPQLNQAIGKVYISIVGGNPSYSYLWSNGSTSEDLNNMDGGVYTVTVTDIGGCQKNLSATVASNLATITPVVTSNDCYRKIKCGSHIEIEQAGTYAGDFTSCNRYTKYCDIGPTPMREVVVDINQTINWNGGPFTIFDQVNCTLNCLDGGTNYFGVIITDEVLYANYETFKCSFGNACLFSTINLDGTFHETLLVPYSNATTTSISYTSVYNTTHCPNSCLVTFKCGTHFLKQICDWGEPCPPEPIHQPDTLEMSLLEFVDAIITNYSVDEVGVHKDAKPDMSVREYENLISGKEAYPILPFSKILLPDNELVISPNPFSDVINIAWKNEIEMSEFSVFNAIGQLILNDENLSTTSSLGKIEVLTQNLPSGVYHISCKLTNGNIVIKKLIKI